MAGKSATRKKVTKPSRIVEQQTEDEAVQEALDELDEESFENDGSIVDFGAAADSFDVFAEGFKRANEAGDSVRYHIKKNSQFLCVKDYPYSWEDLQREFGGGYYQIIAKRRSNGLILKQQSESIAEDPNKTERSNQAPQAGSENLSALAMVQQFQERAEERARSDSKSNESGLASVMQTVAQMQQKSTEMMMTMMMESSKQTQNLMMAMMANKEPKGIDPVVSLLTTLLTKDTKPTGMAFEQVLKMLADKERDTRQAVEKQYETIEKKADALATMKAEAMTAGEGGEEESGLSGMMKGFLPVLAQLAQSKQNQPTITPEQEMQMRIEAERRASGGGIPQNFLDENPMRPAIPAPSNRPRQQQQQPTRPAQNARPVAQPEANRAQNPVQPGKVVQEPQDPVALSRLKERILAVSGMLVVQGRMENKKSDETAEICLIGLEKEGISRQTVANTFKLEDFHKYAESYGATITAEDAEWLREFYEYIKTSATPVVASVTQNPKPQIVPGPIPPAQTVNGSAAKPAAVVKPRAGARSGGSSKGGPERNI